MKSRVILLVFFILSLIYFNLWGAQEKASSRAIFMSTAGSAIQTTPQKVAKAQTLPQKIPAGLALEVVKIYPDGTVKTVNPSKHIFKTGDKFIVKFQTNLPGIVEVFNITPDKRINFLGTWQVPAFQPVQLPPEAEFQLTKPVKSAKGIEELQFMFYPCRVSPQIASRDIRVVSPQGGSYYGDINEGYLNLLPGCRYENQRVIIENEGQTSSYQSRDIITSTPFSKSNYEGGYTYAINEFSQKEFKPLRAVLRIHHK